jgi:hypothetical protein
MRFSTDDRTTMLEVGNSWATDAITSGTARKAILIEDRSNPGHYTWNVFFDSAEDAGKNNERPETGEHAQKFGALMADGIAFAEYDVVAIHE